MGAIKTAKPTYVEPQDSPGGIQSSGTGEESDSHYNTHTADLISATLGGPPVRIESSERQISEPHNTDASSEIVPTQFFETSAPMNPARANIVIFQLALINFMTSVSTGIIVVGLPQIALELSLPQHLFLWPSSVYGLTAGSTLLLAGAIADVVGARSVELVGCALLGCFTLACGLSQTGIQLVVFRALQGVAAAMHMPCSVSLVSQYVPSGKRRNIGFSCLGLSQPLGFSVGLVIGGILVEKASWRIGFYVGGAVMLLQTAVMAKAIPAEEKPSNVFFKIRYEIDWVGATIACTGLAIFSYVLAILSADSRNMDRPSSVVMLLISVLLMLSFPIWMNAQEKRSRPALIPNSLWKSMPFSCICVLTILTWGLNSAIELFSSLYFQEIQEFSALQASLRILPSLLVGTILNVTTGYLVDKAPAFWLVLVSTILTAGSPLLMALIDPRWSYWKGAFYAQLLSPLSVDVLFTVGLLIVSEIFSEKTQALAGAVFNCVAFFGLSLVVNLMQVVSLLVTKGTQYRDKSSPPALLKGYQASFWAMFAATATCALLCTFGLRNVGRIGLKRE